MLSEENNLTSILRTGNPSKIDEAFRLIYDRYSRLVAFVISKYIDSVEDIKDLVSETFLRFFNNADSVKNIKAFLAATARNLAIDYLRKEKPVEDISIEEEDLFSTEDSNHLYKDLLENLQKILSEEEIEILILHSVYGFNFKEIGKKLNMKENTTKTIYHRAIKKYRGSKGC